MQDVPELLVKGPGMIYCEEIGQAVLALVLLMIFLVQVWKEGIRKKKTAFSSNCTCPVCPFDHLLLALKGTGASYTTKCQIIANDHHILLNGHRIASADDAEWRRRRRGTHKFNI
jgi:hypothetical protein